MSLQIGRDGEGAVAILALVRLLARVRPQVAGQIGRAREDLSAKFARIAVAGFVDAGACRRLTGRGRLLATQSLVVAYAAAGRLVMMRHESSGRMDERRTRSLMRRRRLLDGRRVGPTWKNGSQARHLLHGAVHGLQHGRVKRRRAKQRRRGGAAAGRRTGSNRRSRS